MQIPKPPITSSIDYCKHKTSKSNKCISINAVIFPKNSFGITQKNVTSLTDAFKLYSTCRAVGSSENPGVQVLFGRHGPSLPGTFNILIGNFFYFVIRFLNQIFFVINFSYFVIRFLLNSSIVKSDNEIGKF